MKTSYHCCSCHILMVFTLQSVFDDVEKMIIGKKCDLEKSRIISTERGELVAKLFNVSMLDA